MKRLIFIVVLLASSNSYGATAQDLITSLISMTGETNDTTVSFTKADALQWLNQAQDVINRIGGYLERDTTYTIASADSFGVALPTDAIDVTGVILWDGVDWQSVIESHRFSNPDQTQLQWSFDFNDADVPKFYLKGSTSFNGQQVRIFYKADATDLADTTTVISLTKDLHVFIVEEAMVFYLINRRNFQTAFALRQQIRQDMGIIKQVEKQ